MFGLYPLYFMVFAPGLVLALWAQWRMRRAFRQGTTNAVYRGATGAQAAAEVLRAASVMGVAIEPVAGFLTDHYDRRNKVLCLSPAVYYGQSLAALGIAAHEAGHALQDAMCYPLLKLRNGLVRIASIGGLLFWLLLMASFTLIAFQSSWSKPVLWLGIGVFVLTVLLQLVSLPVEFDASNRAGQMLLHSGMIAAAEDPVVQRMLHTAVVTHVAAILTTALTLLYLCIRTALLHRRHEVDQRQSALPGAYGGMQGLVPIMTAKAGKRQI